MTQSGFAHHICKLKLLVTHCYSFYGSSLLVSITMKGKSYILLVVEMPGYHFFKSTLQCEKTEVYFAYFGCLACLESEYGGYVCYFL